ncbi:Neuronal pentraxin-2-like 6, partial [Homarus americanus]
VVTGVDDGRDEGAGVKVFGLQVDTWAAPRDDVMVRYNMCLKITIYTISNCWCGEVLPHTVHYILFWDVNFNNSPTHVSPIQGGVCVAVRKGGTNGLYYNGNKQYGSPTFTTEVSLHQWVHYCHVFSTGHYRAFVNGEERTQGTLYTQDLVLALNSTLILGQEQDLLVGGYDVLQIFRGYISQVNIWDRALGEEEVRDMASCQADLRGNVFSSDKEYVEVLGASVRQQHLNTLCQKLDEYVIFPEMRYLGESQLMCLRVGYEVYGPKTKHSNFALYNESLQFTDSCSSNYHLWLGLTDEEEEGRWRTFLDDSVVQNTSFEVAEPNGKRSENCILMFRPNGLWVDTKCSQVFKKKSRYLFPTIFIRIFCLFIVYNS